MYPLKLTRKRNDYFKFIFSPCQIGFWSIFSKTDSQRWFFSQTRIDFSAKGSSLMMKMKKWPTLFSCHIFWKMRPAKIFFICIHSVFHLKQTYPTVLIDNIAHVWKLGKQSYVSDFITLEITKKNTSRNQNSFSNSVSETFGSNPCL